MKNSNNSLRLCATAFIFLSATAFTEVAHAEISPVSVKYMGKVNSAPVFQLSFTNEQTETYEITITENNSVIYTENVTGKELVRKFQFVNEGAEEEVLNVTIKNVKTNKAITYKINPATTIEVEKELVATL